MLDILCWAILAVIPVITWFWGYYVGKANDIHEVRYLLEEQWRDYEMFRDWVFEEMGIGVDDE